MGESSRRLSGVSLVTVMAHGDSLPSYLHPTPEDLAARAQALRELMRSCRLCPRACGANRLAGDLGACRTGAEPIVSSYAPHFGEERPLVGRGGSGTIFLTNCNLACVFCQNRDISQLGEGRVTPRERLADMMLGLQRQGCHNVNWVTPTHQIPMLVDALRLAAREGLRLPIVYNCGGYESVEALRLLDGIVDIYMPDAKYGDNAAGAELSGVPDYWDRCKKALAEMHRQVGDLQTDARGLAVRGLLVRHLALPEDKAKTSVVTNYLASLSANTYVNIMAQYRPEHRARNLPGMGRPVTPAEYRAALQAAISAGLHRLDDRWPEE